MTDFPPGPLLIEPLLIEPQRAKPQRAKPQLVEPQLDASAGGEAFVWEVPGSKSITNRALVLAALTEGTTTLNGVLHSDDTRHMRAGLEALGITIEDIDATTLRVTGGRGRLRAPSQPLFVGNSGTTVRFLAALATLVPGEVTLVGDEHMAKRPITHLVEGLRQLGVSVECASGCPPLTILGGELSGGTVRMPGNKSSQYFSALLMAAPLASSPVRIEVEGNLVSRPYVEITQAMMTTFGAQVTGQDDAFEVVAGGYAPLKTGSYAIEPDASSASYAFATAAALGLSITVPRLGQGSLQGDYSFVDLLADAGATVLRGEDETTVRGARHSEHSEHSAATPRLRALDVDMHHISDTVMTLAALAPLCDGTTRITNVENIRIKETDRLEATVNELRRLGQTVEAGRDWLSVTPAELSPCVVRSYSDHRMAMAFAILGLARAGVSIEDPACVAKTYPTFWQALRRLYTHVGQTAPF